MLSHKFNKALVIQKIIPSLRLIFDSPSEDVSQLLKLHYYVIARLNDKQSYIQET